MPKQRKRRLIEPGEHQLLSIKEILDTIIKEAEVLPAEVRQSIVTARDQVWSAFVQDQEKTMRQ